jgi:hypothetical protein
MITITFCIRKFNYELLLNRSTFLFFLFYIYSQEDKNIYFEMSKEAPEVVSLRVPHAKIFMASVHFRFVVYNIERSDARKI